jgi:hypothetical protein
MTILAAPSTTLALIGLLLLLVLLVILDASTSSISLVLLSCTATAVVFDCIGVTLYTVALLSAASVAAYVVVATATAGFMLLLATAITASATCIAIALHGGAPVDAVSIYAAAPLLLVVLALSTGMLPRAGFSSLAWLLLVSKTLILLLYVLSPAVATSSDVATVLLPLLGLLLLTDLALEIRVSILHVSSCWSATLTSSTALVGPSLALPLYLGSYLCASTGLLQACTGTRSPIDSSVLCVVTLN